MSFYRRKSTNRVLSVNNNCTSRQRVQQGGQGAGIALHECDHCNSLESDINRQEGMLAEKDGILKEMNQLIDWLKRDIMKANKSIYNLGRGTDSEIEEDDEEEFWSVTSEDIHNVDAAMKEPDISAETLGTLEHREELLHVLETRLDKDETEIEELQRRNQSLYEELWELELINKDNEKDLKINKEVEMEQLEKLKRVAVENEDLKYKTTRLRAERDAPTAEYESRD